ncbi:MAG: hypothetical protein JXB00_02225 [Bacteroidales bacterium]|nr:hypothetical protein [Bacteroidales bacterium]
MAKESNDFNLNSADLIAFAWEKRTPLIIVSVIAIVVSTIFSYRITELYKSSVVLYPVPAASASKYLFTSSYPGRQTLYEFGEEEQCDQLLQILNSDNIKNRIIEKYDLFKHYELDPNGKHKNYEMNKQYRSKIKFRRTRFISASIEVMDKDPVVAANIANDIADLVDSVMNEIQHERKMAGFKMVEKEFIACNNSIKEVEDSLRIYQKMGIVNVEYQSKELTLAHANALIEKNEQAARTIENKLKTLEKHAAAYTSLSEKLILEYNRRMSLEMRYIEAKTEAEQILSYKYVVDPATPADKKSYPKKSLIILQSTLATFVFAYIILLLLSIIKTAGKAKKN